MAAVEAGTISEETWLSTVPIVVSMLMSGPSSDFIIGRIFEAAVRDAYREIAERVGGEAKMVDEAYDEVRFAVARNLYRESNCALID